MAERSATRWLWYLMYGSLLTAVLLVVRFPTVKFTNFIEHKIELAFPGTNCELISPKYRFPFALQLEAATFSRQRTPLVVLNNIRLRPTFSGMGSEYSMRGEVAGGSFSSMLKLAYNDGEFALSDMHIQGVRLEELENLVKAIRREVRGTLELRGSYSGSFQDTTHSGEGIIIIRDGGFSLAQQVLTLEEVNMERLESEYSITDEKITLSGGILRGPEIQAQFLGSLVTDPQLANWDLELAGNLTVQRNFLRNKPEILRVVKRLQKLYRKNALPFAVSGRVGNPRFGFGSG